MVRIQTRLCSPTAGSLTYHEFRGSGPPSECTGTPGDVYLDIQGLRVWYFTNTWVEWQCLSRNAVHPSDLAFILVPTVTMFSWVHSAIYASAKVQAKTTFGHKFSPSMIVQRYLAQEIDLETSQKSDTSSPMDKESHGNSSGPILDNRPAKKVRFTSGASAGG